MRQSVAAAMCILGLLAASEAGVTAPKQVRTKSGVEMMAVAGGWFTMGDAKGEPDETPHKVYVSSLYMDKYLVTQKEYAKLMGKNPSRWKGEGNPVEQVRWSDAVRYCNERSKREGLRPCYDLRTWQCDFSADGYRLPTEAEWEWACRAGTTGRYSFGDSAAKLEIYAWFKDNAAGRPRPAGQKLPNPWGLFDMHGNVWEWCNDFYAVDYYRRSPDKDPRGPDKGDAKVVRGGCWRSPAEQCRSSHRNNEAPGYADVCFGYDIYGFRAVRRAPGK